MIKYFKIMFLFITFTALNADIVDNLISIDLYNAGTTKVIQTKVAGELTTITGVHVTPLVGASVFAPVIVTPLPSISPTGIPTVIPIPLWVPYTIIPYYLTGTFMPVLTPAALKPIGIVLNPTFERINEPSYLDPVNPYPSPLFIDIPPGQVSASAEIRIPYKPSMGHAFAMQIADPHLYLNVLNPFLAQTLPFCIRPEAPHDVMCEIIPITLEEISTQININQNLVNVILKFAFTTIGSGGSLTFPALVEALLGIASGVNLAQLEALAEIAIRIATTPAFQTFGEATYNRCAIACAPTPAATTTTDFIPGIPRTVTPRKCYECVINPTYIDTDTVPVSRLLYSTDDFAIRPDKFDLDIYDLGMDPPPLPDEIPIKRIIIPNEEQLLRSGMEYGVSLRAINQKSNPNDTDDDAPTNLEYNTIYDYNLNIGIRPNAIKYFKNDIVDLVFGLSGLATLTPHIIPGTLEQLPFVLPSYMVGGLSSMLPIINPIIAQDVLNLNYSDVGKVKVHVYDGNWSAIDNDDTPMDCISPRHTYICGEQMVTFIPHHFAFTYLDVTNNTGPDSNFTYIAKRNIGLEERSLMAGRVNVRIEAHNKYGFITANFREEVVNIEGIEDMEPFKYYYENNVSIAQRVNLPFAEVSGVNEKQIGFKLGVKDISWDEETYPLEFNFSRDISTSVNPFHVYRTNLDINITSKYKYPLTMPDSNATIITGYFIGPIANLIVQPIPLLPLMTPIQHHATMYYGKTKASKYFYEDVTEAYIRTPIEVNVYCDYRGIIGGILDPKCSDFGIDTALGETNEPAWWLSLNHSMARGDGNVSINIGTVFEGLASPSINGIAFAAASIESGGIDGNITVIANSTLRPMTVPLELSSTTSKWLIYNQDGLFAPTPFYKVRFIDGTNQAKWSGEGETGYIINIDSSYKKSKRLDW